MSETAVKKLAFVGTSCIGKTALLEYYQARHQGDESVALVPEAARIFFSTQHVEDRRSEATQGRLQDLIMDLERDAEAKGATLLYCDRSVIDAPAYVRAEGDIEGSRRLLERVRFWLPTYDAIVLLDPADVPYVTDDIRTESAETRERLHGGFLELFEQEGIRYHMVGGTMQERVQQIDVIAGVGLPGQPSS